MNDILPGECVLDNINKEKQNIYIGNGLMEKENAIISTVSGKLDRIDDHTFFINTTHKMYYPMTNDEIVGIVIDRRGDEGYIVDINSYQHAFLPREGFEGATKRNMNILKVFFLF
jgi:exosome complex RNA-binding protein Rrp4